MISRVSEEDVTGRGTGGVILGSGTVPIAPATPGVFIMEAARAAAKCWWNGTRSSYLIMAFLSFRRSASIIGATSWKSSCATLRIIAADIASVPFSFSPIFMARIWHIMASFTVMSVMPWDSS